MLEERMAAALSSLRFISCVSQEWMESRRPTAPLVFASVSTAGLLLHLYHRLIKPLQPLVPFYALDSLLSGLHLSTQVTFFNA